MKTLLNALLTAVLCGTICGSAMVMTLEVLDLRARVEQLEETMEPLMGPLPSLVHPGCEITVPAPIHTPLSGSWSRCLFVPCRKEVLARSLECLISHAVSS